MKSFFHIFWLIPLMMVLSSCATRKAGWETTVQESEIGENEKNQLISEAKALWAQRADTEKLKESLNLFEKLHGSLPNDLEVLIYLTRGYYFLADAHTQDMDQKKSLYEKAAAFGEKAMATQADFKQKVSSGSSVEEALKTLTIKEVPAIYWSAASLGKWAKASGITAALKYKTRIKAMISRVEELDPKFFYGAAPRYWGGFYAVAPSFAGGDLKKSKEKFDESIKLAPEYVGTKVLMAEVYWTKVGDKKQFEATLKEVLQSSYDKHPELGPENIWEKKKAQTLLNNVDELF